jgi:hypothetical protein
MPKKQYYVPDMTGVMVTIPSGYTSRQVSGFEAVVYDGEVPIGWGFRCKGQAMETSRWESFPGERVCVGIKDAPGGERVIGEWVYVERWLKPSEAVEVYGAVSALGSDANNGGVEAQVRFLVGHGAITDEILRAVKEATND